MNTDRIKRPGIILQDGRAEITVWAPEAQRVTCRTYDPPMDLPLSPQSYGYWHGESGDLKPGQTYRFVVDGKELPDPASLSQPQGVHGPSAIVDLSFAWTDHDYQPPLLQDLLIYELHVGTFTWSHDFDGVIERIPHLKDLGINAIEIMPVAQFPGSRNWGYDGVFSFAVQDSYGGARGLQRLVNACHREGIAVILDVVYNHFGPEGNYLPGYGPYFTNKYSTPWGEAINYDDAWNLGARDFVVANALMWFKDFHIDALRMDAVHAIKDFSPTHILQEIRAVTDRLMAERDRSHYLIVECDLNDKRYLEPLEKNGYAMDAQWLDEFHHALRVAAGEDRKGYYEEFNGVAHLAKAFDQAYVFDGNYSTHRQKFFGSSARGIPGERFIVFSQNHDQVGNRMRGERSSMLYDPATQRLMALSTLISPFVPMLFMGEEWSANTPFLYFVSHSDEALIQAVREGRRQEFAAFHADGAPPDPQAEGTFAQCVLDWEEKEDAEHQLMWHYYKALIKFRKDNRNLLKRAYIHVEAMTDQQCVRLVYKAAGRQLLCVLNFSISDQTISVEGSEQWRRVLDSSDAKWGGTSAKADDFSREVTVAARSGAVFLA